MSRDIKYIGMDVHKEAVVIVVLNSSGKLVMESIVETKASSILQFIHGLRGELHVTWEEGTWAAWLYDLLQPQVTCNSPRRPWINCRMLLALVSTIDSITSFPLPLRTAITVASLCTSMPIYLMSRLISVASLGERSFASTGIFPSR